MSPYSLAFRSVARWLSELRSRIESASVGPLTCRQRCTYMFVCDGLFVRLFLMSKNVILFFFEKITSLKCFRMRLVRQSFVAAAQHSSWCLQLWHGMCAHDEARFKRLNSQFELAVGSKFLYFYFFGYNTISHTIKKLLYVMVAEDEPFVELSSHWDIVQAIMSGIRPPIADK